MSEQPKYSDERGKKHDTMLGAHWADEEANKPKKSSGGSDDLVKVILVISLAYMFFAFWFSRKIVTFVAPAFSHTTPGGVTILGFCLALIIAYFVFMTRCKSSGTVFGYSFLVTGVIGALTYWLPYSP
ncbi:hypothetical protein [Pseudomonas putida]|uniref:hypothetical protein n=1 Tax=Pseudomonas putida TaxID=303 RepID=UPI00235CA099|nr:hypothetical protein [Pseudomonas putida]GLO23618.1 hypothetical protein PPUJ21368_14450 [Pseudomonas putida]HDS0971429.1 hypothetical protein [Pseudomonas putida]